MVPPPATSVSNLPVLQKTVETYKLWHGAYAAFPRLSKFTLGSKIDTLFNELTELLLLAGYAGREQKPQIVIRASAKLDVLKFFLQVAWELKCVDHKKFGALSAPLAEVGKMVGGWQRQLQTKQPPSQGQGLS